MTFDKINKQKSKARRIRLIQIFWMTLAFYGILVPFTAEMATVPMIGGLLIKFESQTAVMSIFAFVLTFVNHTLYISIIWLHYKPVVSFCLWVSLATVVSACFKTGESVPTE